MKPQAPKAVFPYRSPATLVAFLMAISTCVCEVRAQLFDNLESYDSRLEAGDPSVPAVGFFEGPKGLVIADFDGQNGPDIAVSNLDGTVTVHLNQGDGTFHRPRHLQTGSATLRGIAAMNLLGNAGLDIATAAPRDSKVYIFENDGVGNFSLPAIELDTWGGARNLTGFETVNGRPAILVAGANQDAVVFERTALGMLPRATNLGGLTVRSDPRWFPKPVYSMAPISGGESDAMVMTHTWSENLWLVSPDNSGTLRVEGVLPITINPIIWDPIAGLENSDFKSGGNGVYALVTAPIVTPANSSPEDLITVQRNLGQVEIRRGKLGPERFESTIHQTILLPGAPRAVNVIDLDGDGWNDLAVVLRNLDRIITYRNEKGTLIASHELPVGRSPRELRSADFNRDGIPDFAVINRVSSDISILTGHRGTTGFAATDQFFLVDGRAVQLEVTDLNNDKRDDVIQLHAASHDISVRLATSTGGLELPVFYSMGTMPAAFEISDLNGDTIPDLSTANLGRGRWESGSVTVRLGDGKGGFGPPISFDTGSLAGGLFALQIADFDGDGIADIAAGFFDCRLAFYRGVGDGTFEYQNQGYFVREARAMAVGDFDQDGDMDIAGAGFAGDLGVFENRGDFFTADMFSSRKYPSPTMDKFGTQDMVAVDTNMDGDLDFIIGSGDGTMVYEGIEGMGFQLVSVSLPGTEFANSSVTTADFDGDNHLDIAVSCEILSCVTLLTGNGQGNFVPALTVDVPAARLLATGDLDGDGNSDLVGSGEILWTALSSRRAETSAPLILEGERNSADHVVINELMVANDRVEIGGTTPDWVELFNGATTTTDLSGHTLRLDRLDGDPASYVFPAGTTLAAGDYLLVAFSRYPAIRFPYTADFKISSEGGTLTLLGPNPQNPRTIDRVAFSELEPNVSMGRFRDGVAGFSASAFATPGTSNRDSGPLEPRLESFEMSPMPVLPNQPIRLLAKGTDDIGIINISLVYSRNFSTSQERVQLFDDGLHEDGAPQDGVFSNQWATDFPSGTIVQFYIEIDGLFDDRLNIPRAAYFDANGKGQDVYSFLVDPPMARLEISEVVACNRAGLADENGSFADWVEIRNCSDRLLSLDGVSLTKSYPVVSNRYDFPADTTLQPGEHLVVFCDRDTTEGPLHAPFNLNASGDRVFLISTMPSFGTRFLMDSVEFGPQKPDLAYARRDTECDAQWTTADPTPGSANNQPNFLRGDANTNGRVNFNDAIHHLKFLFLGEGVIECQDSADSNDDGHADFTDAVYTLIWLILGRVDIPAPGPEFCGEDPANDDGLGCASYPADCP